MINDNILIKSTMNLLYFPKDIIIEISQNLPLKNLILVEQINHYFQNIIRETRWYHLTVCLRKLDNIEYVIQNYHFMKCDFNSSSINDNNVKCLANCHTLYLNNCNKITEETIINVYH